ncbi:unnamed protein product [Rotaria sordida]|uniref:Kinesin light chain n=1 Tax=Rotaria sordida TaxID=392033 RepID=A0A814CNR5_9BILA|nr:unnamed protein product [Rotaria sordida]
MGNKNSTITTNGHSSSVSTKNKYKKSLPSPLPATSGPAAITTNSTAVLPHSVRRILQNFLLIWLDANIDESKKDFKNSLKHLRHIVASITTFTDSQECVNVLSEIKKEKVFMIVSGSLGQYIVPEIHTLPQLDSIYVFCGNQLLHEEWAKTISKVKGVYTDIEPICKAIQIDRERCDQAMISISFRGIDPLFMYTQLFKEVLLEIDDDDTKSIKELVDYCRLQNDIAEDEIKKIEQEYHHHSPIWWYTTPYFIYSMLNRGLRVLDVDIILQMGFFIRHLHQHIEKLYREQQSTKTIVTTPFQASSDEDRADYCHQLGWVYDNIGEYSKALLFYEQALDISKKTHPSNHADLASSYNNIGNVYYNMGEYSKVLSLYEQALEIRQKSLSPNHPDLAASYNNIGNVYNNLGEYSKALSSHERALDLRQKTLRPNHPDMAASYNNIGNVYYNIGEYSKALSSHEQALDLRQKTHRPNHPDLADSYSNIGNVYYNMGEYSKALSSHERALEIKKKALPSNHPDLATSYNNIGQVYKNMGEYLTALSYVKRAFDIRRKNLPPNHPALAASYNSIGSVYCTMREYSKALSSHEQALDIATKVLPPNHPDLATSLKHVTA